MKILRSRNPRKTLAMLAILVKHHCADQDPRIMQEDLRQIVVVVAHQIEMLIGTMVVPNLPCNKTNMAAPFEFVTSSDLETLHHQEADRLHHQEDITITEIATLLVTGIPTMVTIDDEAARLHMGTETRADTQTKNATESEV